MHLFQRASECIARTIETCADQGSNYGESSSPQAGSTAFKVTRPFFLTAIHVSFHPFLVVSPQMRDGVCDKSFRGTFRAFPYKHENISIIGETRNLVARRNERNWTGIVYRRAWPRGNKGSRNVSRNIREAPKQTLMDFLLSLKKGRRSVS